MTICQEPVTWRPWRFWLLITKHFNDGWPRYRLPRHCYSSFEDLQRDQRVCWQWMNHTWWWTVSCTPHTWLQVWYESCEVILFHHLQCLAVKSHNLRMSPCPRRTYISLLDTELEFLQIHWCGSPWISLPCLLHWSQHCSSSPKHTGRLESSWSFIDRCWLKFNYK